MLLLPDIHAMPEHCTRTQNQLLTPRLKRSCLLQFDVTHSKTRTLQAGHQVRGLPALSHPNMSVLEVSIHSLQKKLQDRGPVLERLAPDRGRPRQGVCRVVPSIQEARGNGVMRREFCHPLVPATVHVKKVRKPDEARKWQQQDEHRYWTGLTRSDSFSTMLGSTSCIKCMAA